MLCPFECCVLFLAFFQRAVCCVLLVGAVIKFSAFSVVYVESGVAQYYSMRVNLRRHDVCCSFCNA